MQIYEISIHLSGKLDDEKAAKLSDKIKKFFGKEGKILKENPLKRISTAYPIKKEENVLNFSFFVETLAQNITQLEKLLKQEDRILRYLILKHKALPLPISIKAKAKKPALKKSFKKTASTTSATKTKPTAKKTESKETKKAAQKEPKIKLEDIDKSLEKLLEKEL